MESTSCYAERYAGANGVRQCNGLGGQVRAACVVSLFVRHDMRYDVHLWPNDMYVCMWKFIDGGVSQIVCCFFLSPVVDITGGKARTITSIVFELFWSIGLILLPALSIISGTWSHMYIAISTPTLALLFLYQVIPDSPRWFVRQGKLEQAKEIILEGARVNKIKVPDDVDHLLQMQSDAM